MAYNIKTIVEHYIKVTGAYRDGKISIEQLQSMIERDVQAYVVMKNKELITTNEYDSIMTTLSEFEELFTMINNVKQNLN